MICMKKQIYLKEAEAKQTFANLPIFSCSCEGLFCLQTNYASFYLNETKILNGNYKYRKWKFQSKCGNGY